MFKIIVLLQSKFEANHMAWWYDRMDMYLPALLSINNTIDPDQISNLICSPGVANNLHHALLLPIDTPYCTPIQLFLNKLPAATAKFLLVLGFFCTSDTF